MALRPCARCGEDKPLRSRHLCSRCYGYAKYHGELDRYPLMKRAVPFREQFAEHVRPAAPNECWPWQGHIDRGGYGAQSDPSYSCVAHRAAYECFVGPIPAGMPLDHTCHDRDACKLGTKCPHRRCVNPAHLEPVSPQENLDRGNRAKGIHTSHCLRGHPRTAENLRVYKDGIWRCAPCERLAKARCRQRQRSSS